MSIRVLQRIVKGIVIPLFVLLPAILLSQTDMDGTGASVQDGTVQAEKKVQVVKSSEAQPAKVVVKKREALKSVPKTPKKRVEKAQTRIEKKEVRSNSATAEKVEQRVDLSNAGGLLAIEKGNFQLKRIPEKTFPEEENNGSVFVQVGDDQVNAEIAETGEPRGERRGLFGFSVKTTNFIAKGVLIFIIILILILYRFRSRSKSGNVLKRFP